MTKSVKVCFMHHASYIMHLPIMCILLNLCTILNYGSFGPEGATRGGELLSSRTHSVAHHPQKGAPRSVLGSGRSIARWQATLHPEGGI
jgi:hypothetical protein